MNANCPNCGVPARPDAAFCTSCGSKLETAEPPPPGRSPLLIAIVIAVVVVLVAGGAVAVLVSQRRSDEISTSDTPAAQAVTEAPSLSPPPIPSVPPIAAPPSSPEPPPEREPVSTLDLKTAAGVLRIQSVRIRNLYMECPPPTNVCRDRTGPPYVIVTVVSSAGKGARQVSDAIVPQATESYVLDGQGRRTDFETVRHTEGSSQVELIYADLASMDIRALVLYWEGNPPILLRV
jgi:hypothetical protein